MRILLPTSFTDLSGRIATNAEQTIARSPIPPIRHYMSLQHETPECFRDTKIGIQAYRKAPRVLELGDRFVWMKYIRSAIMYVPRFWPSVLLLISAAVYAQAPGWLPDPTRQQTYTLHRSSSRVVFIVQARP
jgi:hypothetical protein